MKKFFALVVFLTTISMTAQAQFDFGVKGGLNLSKLSLDKKVVSSDNQVGWFIGPTVWTYCQVHGSSRWYWRRCCSFV